ncbi:MAG: hypothetical protein AAFN30_02625 [Actinomycetota bacterium]
MTAPHRHLERTRGRILDESERLRVASEVQLVEVDGPAPAVPRGTLHLGLTDRRLLVVATSLVTRRPRLISEWPTGGLAISITRRRLGGNLIHIATTSPERVQLSFEWVRGHRPRDWEPYRFRQ